MPSKSSKSESAAFAAPLPEQIVVGSVVRPHGVRGEVVLEPLSDRPERFVPGATLGWSRGEERRRLEIETARAHGGRLLVTFAGIADRDAAEALRDGDLTVPLAAVGAPPAGAVYRFELLGCRCFDVREGDLGEVTAVDETPAGWLLRVEVPGRRLQIPFSEAFFRGIDRERRRLDWELPAGYLVACASTS